MTIKERFMQETGINQFQRIDGAHILDLYLGLDTMSRYTLFLLSKQEPKQLKSSQFINVQIGKRTDGQWGTSFSLVNNDLLDLFCHFCEDIIESSRAIAKKEKGSDYIFMRYTKWQNMLAKFNNGLLPASAIKGLTGELYFLKKYLLPKVGEKQALYSWIGPEMADQDFVCGDIWYEVKATVSGAESIHITSIEQLDMSGLGELVIMYLDKTSHTDEARITLNSIYNEVYDDLSSEENKLKLSDILLNLGYYPRREYDDFNFRYSGMERYSVSKDFPCLRKEQLPSQIVAAKYDLSIGAIREFRKEE